METLMKELDKILKEKNSTISSLEWWKNRLEEENAELKKKVEALEYDVKMYQENEVKRNG
jgi:sugar phosphate isomerase/epimerase